jgi:hypothetical protein
MGTPDGVHDHVGVDEDHVPLCPDARERPMAAL